MQVWLIILIILVAMILAALAILFTRIRTMSSIKRIGKTLYRVNYRANYKLDKLLQKGVNDVAKLTSFVSKHIFFGYPIKVKEQISGCSSFAATAPDGDLLAGRNFDYPKTSQLLVHTKPKKGYASYSMVCLAHLGISEEGGTSPESLMGKAMILASPFACVDGMNEKGLHVAVLELTTKPTAQNTGKTPIITTVSVRMLLDKCATTDEAVEMLSNYDMFSSAGSPYHFLITDATGNTVIIEWPDPDQTMVVLPQSYVTNFQLAEGNFKGAGGGEERYKIIENALDKSQHTLSEDDVMKVLQAVRVEFNGNWGTIWSIVYNISEKSMKIRCNTDYENIYKIESL